MYDDRIANVPNLGMGISMQASQASQPQQPNRLESQNKLLIELHGAISRFEDRASQILSSQPPSSTSDKKTLAPSLLDQHNELIMEAIRRIEDIGKRLQL